VIGAADDNPLLVLENFLAWTEYVHRLAMIFGCSSPSMAPDLLRATEKTRES
jgi:hypothetical protein